LTADNLDAHAGMSVPRDRVELNVPGDDWFVQVSVFHLVRVRVAVKYLCTYMAVNISSASKVNIKKTQLSLKQPTLAVVSNVTFRVIQVH